MRVLNLKRFMGKAAILAGAVLLLAMPARPAAAQTQTQTWPQRPVTIVMAFAGGALIDFVGRSLANELQMALGQPVVLESKPGGGGVVAAVSVAKSPADGYTLLMTAVGPAVLRPLMEKNLGYNTDTDFTPVILIGEAPNVLVASPKLGVNTVKELLAYAKTKDNKINIGHSGPGTMGHLCSVLFAAEAGLDANFISYRGTGPMMADVIGGQIEAGLPANGPGTNAGKILAVTSTERLDFMPDVPTMKESGYDVVGATWLAIFGPAGMPPEAVAKLNGAINAFLSKPDTRKRFGEIGFHARGGAPARLSETIAQDRARWSKVIATHKLAPDK